MNTDLRRYLRERALDLLDWLDYRPDPHWWPALALPGAVAGAWFLIPDAFWLVLLVTLGLAIAAAACALTVVMLMLIFRALRDWSVLQMPLVTRGFAGALSEQRRHAPRKPVAAHR